MTGPQNLRASMADVEWRLARLRGETDTGVVESVPALEQATEDLSVSLEELHVALEELETTNEKLAAAKLDAEREGQRYREFFQLVPAACLVTDVKGVVLEANEAAETLLGHAARHLVGKPLNVLISGPAQPWLFDRLDHLLAGTAGSDAEWEFSIRSGTGRSFVAGATAVRISDMEGKPTGARWLVRDLTSQIRRERERRGKSDQEAYRHVSRGVIHRLNNLLGAIRGYSEILSGLQNVGARGHRAARQIRAGTERGERLTSQLLSFARAASGRADPCSVNGAVLEACEMAMEVLPEVTHITPNLSPGGGQARIGVLDLYQAVLNLILNARDALVHGGEIRLETQAVEVDVKAADALDLRPGPYVAIAVTDAGTGMAAETQARALEPFFSTKAIGEGFGLGLSTAEVILRKAQGVLDLHSERGVGTTVTLFLPRV